MEEVLARDIHLIRLPLLPYQCRQRLSESIIPHLLAFLEPLFLSLLNQILFCQVTITHRGIAMKNLDFFQYQVRRELAADILAGSAPLSIKYFSIWRVALFMRDSKTSFYPGKKIGAEASEVEENFRHYSNSNSYLCKMSCQRWLLPGGQHWALSLVFGGPWGLIKNGPLLLTSFDWHLICLLCSWLGKFWKLNRLMRGIFLQFVNILRV